MLAHWHKMNLHFMQSMEGNTRANTSTLLTKRPATASRIPVSQKCTNKLFPRKENNKIDSTQKTIPVKRREFRRSTNDPNAKEDSYGSKTCYGSKKGRFGNREMSNVKQEVQTDIFVWKTEKEDRASYSKDDMLLWLTPVPSEIPSEPQEEDMFRKTKTNLGEGSDITTNGNAFDEILSTMNTDHDNCLGFGLNERSNNDHSEVKSLEKKNHEQVLVKSESSTAPPLRPHFSTMFKNAISNHDMSFGREWGLASNRQPNVNERSPKDEPSWENRSRHKEDISGYHVDKCEHKEDTSGYHVDRSGYKEDTSGYDVDRSGYKKDESGYDVGGSGYKEDKTGYHAGGNGYKENASGNHVDKSGYNEDKREPQENREKDRNARQSVIRRHSMFPPHRSDLKNEIEKERDENSRLRAQIEKLSSFIESSEDLRERCETLLAQQKKELEKEMSEKEVLKNKVCCLEELRRNVQRKLDVETEEKKSLKKTLKDIEVKLYEEREKVKVIKKECSSEISKNVELEIVLQTVLEELGSANKLLDVRTIGNNGLVWGKTMVPSHVGIASNGSAKYGVDYNKIREENWNREKNQFEGKIKLLEMDKNKLHAQIEVLQEKIVEHVRIGCNLRENNDVLEFRITELEYQVLELSKAKNNDNNELLD